MTTPAKRALKLQEKLSSTEEFKNINIWTLECLEGLLKKIEDLEVKILRIENGTSK